MMDSSNVRSALQTARDAAKARIELIDRAIAALDTVDVAMSALDDHAPTEPAEPETRTPVAWRDKAGDYWVTSPYGEMRSTTLGSLHDARTSMDSGWGCPARWVEREWGPLTPIYDESEVMGK